MICISNMRLSDVDIYTLRAGDKGLSAKPNASTEWDSSSLVAQNTERQLGE